MNLKWFAFSLCLSISGVLLYWIGNTNHRLNKLEQVDNREQSNTTDTLWNLDGADSSIIYRDGGARKIVTFYYIKGN